MDRSFIEQQMKFGRQAELDVYPERARKYYKQALEMAKACPPSYERDQDEAAICLALGMVCANLCLYQKTEAEELPFRNEANNYFADACAVSTELLGTVENNGGLEKSGRPSLTKTVAMFVHARVSYALWRTMEAADYEVVDQERAKEAYAQARDLLDIAWRQALHYDEDSGKVEAAEALALAFAVKGSADLAAEWQRRADYGTFLGALKQLVVRPGDILEVDRDEAYDRIFDYFELPEQPPSKALRLARMVLLGIRDET